MRVTAKLALKMRVGAHERIVVRVRAHTRVAARVGGGYLESKRASHRVGSEYGCVKLASMYGTP